MIAREPSALRGLLAIATIAWVGYLLASLAGCAALTAACEPAAAPRGAPLPGHLRDRAAQVDAAVSVSVECGFESWVGSGTIVSPTEVLTAGHVARCDDTPKITVRRLTGTADEFPAHVAWESEDWDLARVQLSGGARFEGASAPELGPVPPVASPLCFVAVEPLAMVECGPRLADDADPNPRADVVHGATTMPGNSGSAVYDGAGRVVAVVTEFVDCTPSPDLLRTYCGGRASSVWGRAGVLP